MIPNRSTIMTYLNQGSVICESAECGVVAEFLFRTGGRGLSAHCARHATEIAKRWALELPRPVVDSGNVSKSEGESPCPPKSVAKAQAIRIGATKIA
jgi:hypothetical protein